MMMYICISLVAFAKKYFHDYNIVLSYLLQVDVKTVANLSPQLWEESCS